MTKSEKNSGRNARVLVPSKNDAVALSPFHGAVAPINNGSTPYGNIDDFLGFCSVTAI
jgi:hypothetical protein